MDGRESSCAESGHPGSAKSCCASAGALHQLAKTAGIRVTKAHPHMLRHTFVTTMLDANVDLRDVQIAARHAGRAPPCATTEPARA
jgi:integrase/recombinase XerD